MLIPTADVPRWYAERKPADAIAVRHGEDALSWQQLERGANARARAFAAKGVKPGDAEESLRLIEAERVQWVNFVPTMMHRIGALPEQVRHACDLSSLQVVFHMAALMPP